MPLPADRGRRGPGRRADRPGRVAGAVARTVRPTTLTPALRPLDLVDLAVLEAVAWETLGPVSGALRVDRSDHDVARVSLTRLGQEALLELLTTAEVAAAERCLALIGPALVTEVLLVVGPEWRAEAEIGVELVAAERFDDLPELVEMAGRGVVVDSRVGLGELLAPTVLSPVFVAIT